MTTPTPPTLPQTPRTEAWPSWLNPRDLARQLERELIAAQSALLAEQAKVRELVEGAKTILDRIPACAQDGSLYVMHFDQDGNEIGQEFVDPLAVIQGIESAFRALLARLEQPTP